VELARAFELRGHGRNVARDPALAAPEGRLEDPSCCVTSEADQAKNATGNALHDESSPARQRDCREYEASGLGSGLL
jgi:hypothetical protein